MAQYFSDLTGGRGNTKYVNAVKKVDLLRKFRDKGKISDDEFKEGYDRAKRKLDRSSSMVLSKDGSQLIDDLIGSGGRPNKNRAQDSKSFGNGSFKRTSKADDNTREKIDRHMAIAYATDNYHDYKNHKRALNKLVGAERGDSLKPDINGNIRVIKKGENAGVKPGEELYHTSKADIKDGYLKPEHTSKDGVMYDSDRSYFYTKKAGSRYGGLSDSSDHEYVYAGPKSSHARIDHELNSAPGDSQRAVYIDSDDKLRVKKIK